VDALLDLAVREAAMAHVERLAARFGRDSIPWQQLQLGFEFRGSTIKLIAPQGIFKPATLTLPLSITTSPKNPYGDLVEDDHLVYKYFKTDPNHRDNMGLRRVMEARLPLIYFHGVVEGIYAVFSPVYVTEELGAERAFRIAVVDTAAEFSEAGALVVAEEPVRGYRARVVLQRLHQASFSQRVLRAYRHSCAVCRLRHRELLDAAHIVADRDPGGVPAVRNGLALCKLHHAAFDGYILGITPTRVIEIRSDILDEDDGPMLLHGLKGVHGQEIQLPWHRDDHPAAELLEVRYERFRRAS
jgi:putative restriction endonuclease